MEEKEPIDGSTSFEVEVLTQLRRLGHDISSVKIIATKAWEASEDHKKTLQDHERTLYGHEDSRRRVSEPGVVQVVGELASAFKDVRAVAKAGWAMLGLVGISTAISMFTLFMGLS